MSTLGDTGHAFLRREIALEKRHAFVEAALQPAAHELDGTVRIEADGRTQRHDIPGAHDLAGRQRADRVESAAAPLPVDRFGGQTGFLARAERSAGTAGVLDTAASMDPSSADSTR